jgi:hypothetical protein
VIITLGGIAIEGAINYNVGPSTSVGKTGCGVSCIAMRYGNDRSDFTLKAYFAGFSWTLKDIPMRARHHDTKCIRESKVSINGKDPIERLA